MNIYIFNQKIGTSKINHSGVKSLDPGGSPRRARNDFHPTVSGAGP
ncbi:uncharacterized protein METZ01_LOCUS384003, partial [marine metagenome]